jgi:hypothetical protein
MSFILFLFFSTILRDISIEELVRTSDLIIQGEVKEISCRMEADHIYTYVSVEISKSIKGEFPQEITLRIKGGKIGNIVEKVSGSPSFEKGERVILFLKRKNEFFSVSGMALGKFKIINERGVALVINNAEGLSVYKDGRIIELQERRWRYDEFIMMIRRLLEEK